MRPIRAPGTVVAFPGRSADLRRIGILLGLASAFLAAFLLALGTGPSDLGPARVLSILGGAAAEPLERGLLLEVRLPRAVTAMLVGAALALGGVALQALLRNPLVEPGLVGTSAGAGVGAVAWIVFVAPLVAPANQWLLPAGLPMAAFSGALAATWCALRAARAATGASGRVEGTVLILAGVAIAAMAGAFIGYAAFAADDGALRDLTFWSLGSLARATWPALHWGAPILLAALIWLLRRSRSLDALLVGERGAALLGVDVEREKRHLVAAAALAVGASVALVGAIGFVGLVVPHLARLLVGAGHRALLPAAALLGATLLLIADVGARLLVAPAELPIGILTAALGGPFFLGLLFLRGRRGGRGGARI